MGSVKESVSFCCLLDHPPGSQHLALWPLSALKASQTWKVYEQHLALDVTSFLTGPVEQTGMPLRSPVFSRLYKKLAS